MELGGVSFTVTAPSAGGFNVGGDPDSGPGSFNSHFGIGNGGASTSTGAGSGGNAVAAPPPAISSPVAGRAAPDALIAFQSWDRRVGATGTPKQILDQLPQLIAFANERAKGVSGDTLGEIVLPGGYAVHFDSNAQLQQYLERSSAPAVTDAALSEDVLDVFGRPASPAELATLKANLAGGAKEADLRTALAHSPEAAMRVNGLYQAVLGVEADPAGLKAQQDALGRGATLLQIRSNLAHSPDAAARIDADYVDVFGVHADPAGLAAQQGALAGSTTLAEILHNLAYSPGSAAAVDAAYVDVLGVHADPAGLAAQQAGMAAGLSLAAVRLNLAYSADTSGKINAMYQQLGRADGADPAELDFWQARLGSGTSTLQDVRTIVAHSPEAAARIGDIYTQVLGRGANPAELAAWENALAANATLAQVQAAVAASPEAMQLRSFHDYELGPRREGERLDVYPDSRRILTVGIGHKVLSQDNLHAGEIITQQQSNAFFARDGAAALDVARQQMAQAGIPTSSTLWPQSSSNSAVTGILAPTVS